MNGRPYIDIGIYVLNESLDKIFLGKSRFENFWRVPNGRLQYSENLEDCARNHLFNQFKIEIDKQRIIYLCSLNVLDKTKNLHSIEIDYYVQIKKTEEKLFDNLNSRWCEWNWFAYEDIVKCESELYYGLTLFLKKYKIDKIEKIKTVMSN